MAKEYRIPSIRKVSTGISILWPIACAAMFYSMHYSTPSLIKFFTILALVPILLSWVLVFVSRHLEKRTAPRWMRNGPKAGGKGAAGKGEGGKGAGGKGAGGKGMGGKGMGGKGTGGKAAGGKANQD